MNDALARYRVLGAGILSIILSLGIARFAYTPMLPLMQDQAGLGVAGGGWLAAINYLGYLTGAVTVSLISDPFLKDRLYRFGLVLAVLTTAMMGMADAFWLWSVSRFFAGLSSAGALLLGSGLILNWLIRHDHRGELGVHFSGVVLGIALGTLVVEWSAHSLDWSGQWWLLTGFAALLAIPAWAWLPPPEARSTSHGGAPMVDHPPGSAFMRLFIAAYFCAGVGYVISATFIVAIVDSMPGLQGRGGLTFILIGLAAAPACIFWDRVARRAGDLNALIAAGVLQIFGILLPALFPVLWVTLLGAVLFGGTFIGIVSLVLTMAGRYYPTRPAKMMGKMTISYGIAQIAAPALTGFVAEYTGGYTVGLYLAAAVMAVGTGLLIRLKACGLDSND